ncbi:MAG: response regulator [Chloroflexi bacterium]|nr:response regulator [Chloroflexota bacterium]
MTNPTALVIEDDPKLGVIYQTALRQFGFDAELDDMGRDFRARLVNPAPALIILDIHLPYASGIEILEQIKADKAWREAVVIVATADLFLSKSLASQADHVMIKPVSVDQIMKIVVGHWPDQIQPDIDSQ